MSVHDKIIELLKRNNIQYNYFEHEPVRTSKEAAALRGTDLSHGAKSLIFLADDKPVLLVLAGDKKVDLSKTRAVLACQNLQLADPGYVLKLTTVEVGGIPPFGNAMNLPTYLDKSFSKQDTMDFNVGDKTVSIEMAVDDYIKIANPAIAEIT